MIEVTCPKCASKYFILKENLIDFICSSCGTKTGKFRRLL